LTLQSHLNIQSISDIFTKIFNLFHLKMIFAFFMICFSWIFEGDYQILISLYALVLIDTITGVWYTAKQQNITSRGFFKAARKSFVYFLLIIVARIVDKHTPIDVASSIMQAFLIGTEAFSILENINKLGFPVPTKLVKLLKIYYDKK